jgi:hypothetical protein
MKTELTSPASGTRRQPSDARPMSDIVAELWENTEVLVRKELELSVSELERKADQLKREVTIAAIGGAIAYAGAIVLIASATLLLAKEMDPWIAALLVGAIVSVSGYALLLRGKHQLQHENAQLPRTKRSLQLTAHSFKEALHDARSR